MTGDTDREPPLLVGIDIGSSRIKALLVDRDGNEVSRAAARTPFESTQEGTEAPVPALLDAVRQLLGQLGADRGRVAGAGITGLAESGAPLDRDDRPLAPVLAWHDRRGEDVAERVAARFGPELATRLGQGLRYVSSLAKLGWLLEHGVAQPARWLGVPELCLHALTGAYATEYSLASRTGCWDVGARSWLPEVAAAAGFDVGVFAEVKAAGTSMGQVSPEGARWSGLPEGIPVTIVGHDHMAGVLGSGAEKDDLANSVGTAETIVGRTRTLPDIARAIEAGMAISVFPGGDGWVVISSAARAGLALAEASRTLGGSLADLDEQAAGQPPLDAPGLAESLARRDPPALPDGPTGRVWSTLLHALAASTEEAIGKVLELLGPRPRVVVFGGGAASRPWLAAKAEHLPLPVWRSTAPEAVARGAALVAGVAAAWWPSPADAPAAAVEPVEG